ncbi:MAG: glycosyltransferase [Flavobacteriales bacterium]|nr:glycosyltransferase [Flavobacteriales bacterium]
MEPEVSVILLTYNHSEFIVKSIESVLDQKTNFPFELVLADDFSTDGCREICLDYAVMHPERIRMTGQDKNLGLAGNLILATSMARGKYLAFQEGDDFWLYDKKLQMQYDLLEKDPSLPAAVHNVKVIDGDTFRVLVKDPKEFYQLTDTKNGRVFHTNSWLVRKNRIPDFSSYSDLLICWDILLELKILEAGKVICINDTFSVWRKHEGGNSVKIPLWEQAVHFEKLYLEMIRHAKKEGDTKLIRHYQTCYTKFCQIFSIEMAYRYKKLNWRLIRKSIAQQIKTAELSLNYIPKLIYSYFANASR